MKLKTYFMTTLLLGFLSGGQVVSQDDIKPSDVLKAKMMHRDFLARAKETSEYKRLSKVIDELQEKMKTSSFSERKIQDKVLRQLALSQEKLIDDERRKTLDPIHSVGSERTKSKFLYAGHSACGDMEVPKEVSTAAEMSGALHWAHRRGIKGQGVSVLIMELERVTHDDVSVVAQRGLVGTKNHANKVASVLSQMAPDADLIVDAEWDELLSNIPMPIPQGRSVECIDIINKSVGVKYEDAGHFFIDFERNLYDDQIILGQYPRALLVASIGNSSAQIDVDSIREIRRSEKDRYIIGFSVSELRSKGYLSADVPHDVMMQIKDISLCAMGEYLLMATSVDRYGYNDGTSYSAPTIAGAAALIKSKYPHFKAEHLQEVLLESADRTFFTAPAPSIFPTFIYDRLECPDGEDIATKLKVESKEYSDLEFGKGILNLRNAFVYADLLNEKLAKGAHYYPVHLRNEMLRKIQMDEEKAAKTLGQAWRAYQERKARKTENSSVVDSAHGVSITTVDSPTDTDESELDADSSAGGTVLKNQEADHQ